jgi:hypothetical protein
LKIATVRMFRFSSADWLTSLTDFVERELMEAP